MQRLVLCLGIIGLMAAFTMALPSRPQPPKLYKVEQSIEWWSRTINALEAAKTQLKQSDLPSKNVVYLSDSILAPIQIEITKQVQSQLNAENAAQQKKDTTTKSKKQ